MNKPIGCRSFHLTKQIGKLNICMYCGVEVIKNEMTEVFLTMQRTIDGLKCSAYYIDTQGYKIIFETRTAGSSWSIRKSIKSHFDFEKKDYVIKKEQSN